MIDYKKAVIVIKLMDPRPYNYEYRKPRLSNPTLYTHTYPVNPVASTRAYTTWAPFLA